MLIVTNCNIYIVTFCYNKVKRFCEKQEILIYEGKRRTDWAKKYKKTKKS